MDMTWREYQLRRSGYFRQQKAEWEKVRFNTYYTMAGSGGIDTRKMSIEKFLPLGDEKPKQTVSMEGLNALREMQKQVLKIN